MNKKELCKKVSEQTGASAYAIENIVDSVCKCIVETIFNGEKVHIADFGVFEVAQTKERIRQNVYKNVPIMVPAKKIPRFRFNAQIKKAANDPKEQ